MLPKCLRRVVLLRIKWKKERRDFSTHTHKKKKKENRSVHSIPVAGFEAYQYCTRTYIRNYTHTHMHRGALQIGWSSVFCMFKKKMQWHIKKKKEKQKQHRHEEEKEQKKVLGRKKEEEVMKNKKRKE